MKRSVVLAALLLAVSAPGALAQQRPEADRDVLREAQEVLERSGVLEAVGAVGEATAPQLKRTLDQLKFSLGLMALRVTSDPELKASMAQAAQGMAGLAERLARESSDDLVEVLRGAADRIEEVTDPTAARREPR